MKAKKMDMNTPVPGEDKFISKATKTIKLKKKNKPNDNVVEKKNETINNNNSKKDKKITVVDEKLKNEKIIKKEKTGKRKREIKTENNNNDNNDKDLIEKLKIPSLGFDWNDKDDEIKKQDSSSSEDEDVDKEPMKKKKKLTSAERREQERIKEREIRQREEALANNELPNSIDQFDRIVLASPDDSLVWIKYMAYHLQATEIDKARSIARRALKTINFRKEKEKLDVWKAFLNLESKFGTSETVKNILKEAVQSNDSKEIYLHMLTIYSQTKSIDGIEEIVKLITSKYKTDSKVWYACARAYLTVGLTDKSKHMLQRSLQNLPPNKHVDNIVQFALLENEFGNLKRTKELIEKILLSYPNRIDVWTTYVDLLRKKNQFDLARNVLKRAVVQNLRPKKMKTLFQKYITFEETYGTSDTLEHAKKLAEEYVKKKCNN